MVPCLANQKGVQMEKCPRDRTAMFVFILLGGTLNAKMLGNIKYN